MTLQVFEIISKLILLYPLGSNFARSSFIAVDLVIEPAHLSVEMAFVSFAKVSARTPAKSLRAMNTA